MGVSHLVTSALLLLVSVISIAFIYIYAVHVAEGPSGSPANARHAVYSAIRIEVAGGGPGYIVVYARSLGEPTSITHIYIYDDGGRLLGVYRPAKPVRVEPGRPAAVAIPLILVPGLRGYTGGLRVVVSTSSGTLGVGYVDTSAARSPITVIGLLAGEDVSCDLGNLSVDPGQMHWFYMDLATGRYDFRYTTSSGVAGASGYTKVFIDSSVLDLYSMRDSWEERHKLGPAVLFINPYRAGEEYNVTVIDINGNKHVFTLPKLVDDPDKVVIDALLLWEDLWKPVDGGNLDNYIDHVVRVTIFANSTVRIEPIRASGCYLHMFLYSPRGLPSIDSVPDLIREYMENNYRLPAGAGAVYVKAHGAWLPPAGTGHLWDPVKGEWVATWPPVFVVR
ncbi:hypothetical protein CF15_01785 [Pyrodictium occultum]|uniref:DUF2341 domain-containing protein n=2 Tax=Pyrodictium occultum TaxID=2309 RepID=A0A0V8RU55_PYROC|nr:hypothetical protein CF15_01785 [Pyrodictium occultum]